MMQRSRPTVSVIIPVHNAAEWLAECLASVVNQEFPAHTMSYKETEKESGAAERMEMDRKQRQTGIERKRKQTGMERDLQRGRETGEEKDAERERKIGIVTGEGEVRETGKERDYETERGEGKQRGKEVGEKTGKETGKGTRERTKGETEIGKGKEKGKETEKKTGTKILERETETKTEKETEERTEKEANEKTEETMERTEVESERETVEKTAIKMGTETEKEAGTGKETETEEHKIEEEETELVVGCGGTGKRKGKGKGMDLEVSVFLDSCSDGSREVVEQWSVALRQAGYLVIIGEEHNTRPRGVGYAKNRAVEQSRGEYLCFMDSDDVMLPTRIHKQYELARRNHTAIVGSRFRRDPEDSTLRYTRWANTLTPRQLETQIFMSHGPTVIMPTWFFHRSVFERVGGFSEGGAGTPEDLIFFFQHLRCGGRVLRCDEELLVYRYHPHATTFSVSEQTIWDLRVREIEERVLSGWQRFTIWNAGKQGRRFYRSLSRESQDKVEAFCDVDPRKVGSVYTYEECSRYPRPTVPITHFSKARPPLVVCMKMDLTGGKFEENLESLKLKEGIDYHLFN